MRTLIIADVHGNLPALQAVLATPQARSFQRIISLGDQVNFGPQPREVMALLEQHNALMLRGNHEDRLLRADAPEYAGYNWALQRWTARQLQGIRLDHPLDRQEGPLLFTHGTPGQPFHLIQEDEVPSVLDSLPAGITHLFSGHNHKPWHIAHGGRLACNPGSLGMLEDGVGGYAPFVIMDDHGGRITLTRCGTHYDTRLLQQAFIATGCAASAPELTRAVLHTMLTGEYQGTLKLVQFVSGIGSLADENAWKHADRIWHWQEPLSTAEYWQRLEEELM